MADGAEIARTQVERAELQKSILQAARLQVDLDTTNSMIAAWAEAHSKAVAELDSERHRRHALQRQL